MTVYTKFVISIFHLLTNRLSVFFFLFFTSSTFIFAQDNHRIEFLSNYRVDKHDNLQLVPLKHQGFLLISASSKQKGKWIFSLYDTCLKKTSEKSIIINHKLTFQAKHKDGSNLYLLFTKYKSDEFQIIRFNTVSHLLELHTIKALKKFYFTGFRVMKEACFVSGIVGQTSLILHFDLTNKKTKVLPASLTKKLEIDSIEKDSVGNMIHFCIISEKPLDYDLVIKSFSVEGMLVDELKVKHEGENKLISGKVSVLEDRKKIVIGTYSDGSSSLADGIYIAGFQLDNTQEYIRFYPFTDFKNFFSYLPEEQQKRIDKLKEKQKALKGKDVRLQYRLLVHSPIQQNKSLILVAEAYFPLFKHTPKIDWQGRREGVTSEIIFEGYQHTHAVVMSFGAQGNMNWDNVFKIEHVKNKELQKIIHLYLQTDSLSMVYGAEGFIRSKTIQSQRIIENDDKVKIPMTFGTDKIIKTYSNEIAYWYDKHFLAWGYQFIENTTAEGKKRGIVNTKQKRNVFYVAKVHY
ncbi:MAG: hypothetical protein EAZ08_09350 [Cytophagales bacterium]|nr:MAG: hypothetical protein EAZ08_09350 [Cytophagales bacterium]